MEYEILQTGPFTEWLSGLRDLRARQRILVRIRRVSEGNFGSHRKLVGGVSELKIDVGQGYRVYYTIRRQTIVILLYAGNKSTQDKDIRIARQIANKAEV